MKNTPLVGKSVGMWSVFYVCVKNGIVFPEGEDYNKKRIWLVGAFKNG